MPENRDVDVNAEIRPARLRIEDKDKLRQIENELQGLIFTSKTVDKIKTIFQDEINKGLKADKSSSLQMENTYIPELPDGTENGKFLALDLGGTNFRVLLVEFESGQIVDVQVQHYHISDELRVGPGIDLFDYLAECMCDFLRSKGLKGQSIPLGFTFSFPMAHHSLKTGVLVNWTKSFNCSDVIGRDAVQLLNEALERKGCDVSVHAVLNDTTGTLMMGAFLDKNTCIGLILGTGSNACYLEKADLVQNWEGARHGEKEVIIDIEWGAFGDNGRLDFIKTDYDVQVDKNSLLVNSFTFEKYISGKYLGEIVRVILIRLIKKGLLFGGEVSDTLDTPDSFTTAYISKIEEDPVNNRTENIKNIISQLGVVNVTKEDLEIVQYVCRLVSNRSALLVSICLSVVLERMNKEEATIAIDGSLFSKHPRYRILMEKYISLFTDKKFKLLGVTDGSGKGAAIVLAIAMKLEQRFGES